MKQIALLLVLSIPVYIPDVTAKWDIYCFRVFPSEKDCNDGNKGPFSWTAWTKERPYDADEALAIKGVEGKNSLGVTKPLSLVLPDISFPDTSIQNGMSIWGKDGITLDPQGKIRIEALKTPLQDSSSSVVIGVSFHW